MVNATSGDLPEIGLSSDGVLDAVGVDGVVGLGSEAGLGVGGRLMSDRGLASPFSRTGVDSRLTAPDLEGGTSGSRGGTADGRGGCSRGGTEAAAGGSRGLGGNETEGRGGGGCAWGPGVDGAVRGGAGGAPPPP